MNICLRFIKVYCLNIIFICIRIKLVCAGKVLNHSKTLSEQNVPNGATVMALIMAQSVDAAQKENSLYDRVHKIRTDAELLISDNDHSDFLSVCIEIVY